MQADDGGAMKKRTLGKTGLELSIIGYGGFHLIEVPRKEASTLLNTYLDQGGNYIETAAQYGDGISERKIGEAVSHRRDEFVLATKVKDRTRQGALASLERSLRNLRTDRVDLFFMHEPQTIEEAKQILAPGGAMEAFEEAKKAGKARFAAISGHGRPAGIQYSIENHPYDVLMTGFNYFDRFNFPQSEEELLPLCRGRGVGVLGMNRLDHLEQDLAIAENFTPMAEEEKEELYRSAPELGRYVCRQCKKCRGADGFAPYEVFLLEGLFDRQMSDYSVPDPQAYALQERLKYWFDQKDWARKEYGKLKQKVDAERDYSQLNMLCSYGIDVDRKLKIANSKLAGDGYLF